jgi:hypothetical protein
VILIQAIIVPKKHILGEKVKYLLIKGLAGFCVCNFKMADVLKYYIPKI